MQMYGTPATSHQPLGGMDHLGSYNHSHYNYNVNRNHVMDYFHSCKSKSAP